MLRKIFSPQSRQIIIFFVVFMVLLMLESGYSLIKNNLSDGEIWGVQVAVAQTPTVVFTDLSGISTTELVFYDTAYRSFTVPLADRPTWLTRQKVYLVAGYEIVLPAAGSLPFLPSSERTLLNRAELARFIEQELRPQVAVYPQEAELDLTAEGRGSFTGVASVGRAIDAAELIQRVEQALQADSGEVQIPYIELRPEIAISPELKELGVSELIGSITMDYAGSSTDRQTNIRVAASELDGHLIAPDTEFSFNNYFFPLSKIKYREENVIVGGKLIKELGGGICQLSSAVFRVALAAGLPITEQYPHSLKLAFYRPPGLDAAVYPGYKDLKFTNNTGGHILVQAAVVGARITLNLFGTSDGRVAKLTGPYYLDGTPVTDLTQAGLQLLWRRELTLGDGSSSTEEYQTRYAREA